jgi:hypothetical protein
MRVRIARQAVLGDTPLLGRLLREISAAGSFTVFQKGYLRPPIVAVKRKYRKKRAENRLFRRCSLRSKCTTTYLLSPALAHNPQSIVRIPCKLLQRKFATDPPGAEFLSRINPSKQLIAIFLFLLSLQWMALAAESRQAPSASDLAAVSERGRALAAYDQAVWHASDAVQMADPKTAEGERSLARFSSGRWTVVFGALNADKTKFLASYEAVEGDKPQEFTVKHHEPPLSDGSFYLFAARALALALSDFGRFSRPYNSAVLPASSGDQLLVYLYPAQTKPAVYPLGGDVRYLVSSDGGKILEKRQLHKSIIEGQADRDRSKAVAGVHTHVLSDLPEDTDVLHVLERHPALPEIVATPHFLYEIAPDGGIVVKKQRR